MVHMVNGRFPRRGKTVSSAYLYNTESTEIGHRPALAIQNLAPDHFQVPDSRIVEEASRL
jgi:hypothetical protein